jgi:hypothetical protein
MEAPLAMIVHELVAADRQTFLSAPMFWVKLGLAALALWTATLVAGALLVNVA